MHPFDSAGMRTFIFRLWLRRVFECRQKVVPKTLTNFNMYVSVKVILASCNARQARNFNDDIVLELMQTWSLTFQKHSFNGDFLDHKIRAKAKKSSERYGPLQFLYFTNMVSQAMVQCTRMLLPQTSVSTFTKITAAAKFYE